jgi:8-oxo-dGTP pyrophosphatase MutT (NUDIX family)
MNKRIYFQDKVIEFAEPAAQNKQNQAINDFKFQNAEGSHVEILTNFLDLAKKESYRVPSNDFDRFFSMAKKELHYIEAAGGFIEKEGQFLCIHRLGRWDLPKGKLEKGETIKEGAIRECEEECAIKQLTIVQALSSTFHIYPYKDKFAIKQSYWFYMKSTYTKTLKPQTEENIDEVKWFSRQELSNLVLKDTYYTIRDVITEGLNMFS